jgi:hypothetical protein
MGKSGEPRQERHGPLMDRPPGRPLCLSRGPHHTGGAGAMGVVFAPGAKLEIPGQTMEARV